MLVVGARGVAKGAGARLRTAPDADPAVAAFAPAARFLVNALRGTFPFALAATAAFPAP